MKGKFFLLTLFAVLAVAIDCENLYEVTERQIIEGGSAVDERLSSEEEDVCNR